MQDLQSDVNDHEVNLEYVNERGRDLVLKGGDRVDKLKADLTQLNARFEAVARSIEERLTLLESSIEQLTQMNVSGAQCVWRRVCDNCRVITVTDSHSFNCEILSASKLYLVIV